MKVERAKLLVTLRANGRTYKAGRVFLAPDIPQCILQEIRANTGTVEAYGISDNYVDTTERIPVAPVEETMIAPPAELEEIVADANSFVEVEDEPQEQQEETGDGEEEQEEEEVRKPEPPKVVKRSQRRR